MQKRTGERVAQWPLWHEHQARIAEQRAARAQRSPEQQIRELDRRGERAIKERTRLKKTIEERNNPRPKQTVPARPASALDTGLWYFVPARGAAVLAEGGRALNENISIREARRGLRPGERLAWMVAAYTGFESPIDDYLIDITTTTSFDVVREWIEGGRAQGGRLYAVPESASGWVQEAELAEVA
jgi:hypothetical protein